MQMGSPFVCGKTTVSGSAIYSTRTFFADAFETPETTVRRGVQIEFSHSGGFQDPLCIWDWRSLSALHFRQSLASNLHFRQCGRSKIQNLTEIEFRNCRLLLNLRQVIDSSRGKELVQVTSVSVWPRPINSSTCGYLQRWPFLVCGRIVADL